MLASLQKNPWLRLVVLGAIAFFAIALTLTLHRYYNFYASFDQGIFNQVFWNGTQGRFFQSSLSSSLSTQVVHDGQVPEVFYHRLGQHFTPALLLWLPLYALFPSPVTLTVLQVTLITAAGLVLYLFARHHVEPQIAAWLTLAFYGANAVVGPTLGNFHDIFQIPLMVFTLFLALERRWWWLFGAMALLLPLVREDSGVTLFSIGFYLALSRRYPRIGLGLCVWSFGYMVVLTNVIMPLFSEDISRRFMMERFGQYASGEEASSLEIIWGIVSNPLRLIGEIFSPLGETLLYLLGQWLPLAFVPAIAPEAWLIAGFPLLKLFLAQGDSVLSINIRYAMTVVPGLFVGSVFWWSRHSDALTPKFQRFWTVCIALSLTICLLANPNRTLSFAIPDSIRPWVYVPLSEQWRHAPAPRALLAQIPEDASVSASTFLVPHLSGRRKILRFPALQLRNDAGEIEEMEYGIADLWQLQQYIPAFKHDRRVLQSSLAGIDQMLSSQKYGVVGLEDGVILLRRGVPSSPEAFAAWQSYRQTVEAALLSLT